MGPVCVCRADRRRRGGRRHRRRRTDAAQEAEYVTTGLHCDATTLSRVDLGAPRRSRQRALLAKQQSHLRSLHVLFPGDAVPAYVAPGANMGLKAAAAVGESHRSRTAHAGTGGSGTARSRTSGPMSRSLHVMCATIVDAGSSLARSSLTPSSAPLTLDGRFAQASLCWLPTSRASSTRRVRDTDSCMHAVVMMSRCDPSR